MEWSILFHKKFEEWLDAQTFALQRDIAAALLVLKEFGATLGRPYVDTLKGSSLSNLKELRVQHRGDPYRLLFAFDPQRQAIVLVGGNKANDQRWYEKNILVAEERFAEHLAQLEEEEK
ncbi:MAG: type II toxin-antitoxin system RelE/ParE family toxin [Symploca sp. SIO2G7]|nr:type II toxin-antitoxin system RelE/ParE family toxin [Symploca sp. SIO2G7]